MKAQLRREGFAKRVLTPKELGATSLKGVADRILGRPLVG